MAELVKAWGAWYTAESTARTSATAAVYDRMQRAGLNEIDDAKIVDTETRGIDSKQETRCQAAIRAVKK